MSCLGGWTNTNTNHDNEYLVQGNITYDVTLVTSVSPTIRDSKLVTVNCVRTSPDTDFQSERLPSA